MRLALAVVALAIVAAAAWWLPRTGKRANAFLATPQLALESLPAAPLYFNGPARPWLLLLRPDLLLPEDRDVRSERSRAFAQAVLDPKLFRQLDRRSRFETVLFVGDPSQFHTLLDHLASTKDFTLSYVDHTSLVFKRSSAEPWSLEKFAGVRSRLGGMSSRERAQVLALTAAKLIAARRETDAKTLLDEAFALDANCADAWTALASYRLTRGDG
ncbi:MAG TPA: hypothetical protein VEO95_00235, partial [Chthoniobacteraceae bacterium]|nr:hypothetical protein [Chthoniobacteraceae bacterium]